MSYDRRMSRRVFVEMGASALAVTSASSLLGCAAQVLEQPTTATVTPSADLGGGGGRVTYFSRFGVDEAMIREALGAALSRGGEYADIFFQHRVSNGLTLEDGEVNRAYTQVELGVGVRVLRFERVENAVGSGVDVKRRQVAPPDGAGRVDDEQRAL